MRLIKRLMALLCAVLLLGCGGAIAASAGSAQDPLLSQSYVLQWEQMLREDRSARAISAAFPLITDANRSLEMLRVRCGSGGLRQTAVPAGARIALTEGDTITILSGSGSLQGGGLIDLTAGEAFSGGAVPAFHRVLLSEGAKATFAASEASLVALTGTAVLSRYADVPPEEWYGAAIDYADVCSLMNGVGDRVFAPSNTLTRAMFVTILGRMAGVRAADYPRCAFTDVADDAYYAPYIEWARRMNIVSGVGENRFAPDMPATREQLAVIVDYYALQQGILTVDSAPIALPFTAADAVRPWARNTVSQLVRAGALSGYPDGSFRAQQLVTREEACKVLCEALLFQL